MFRIPTHTPRTVDEALATWRPGTAWLAGGTDLVVRMKEGLETPSALVALGRIDTLRGVTTDDRTIRIGSLTSLRALERHPMVKEEAPLLVAAIRRMASPPVRTAATLGGNLCNASPCADTPPPLVCLGAVAELIGPEGRREVPLTEFFRGPRLTARGPDEILTAIRLPRGRSARWSFQKKVRVAVDLAIVNLAAWLTVDRDGACSDARLVAGAVAPVPLRLEHAEARLVGRRLTPDLLSEVEAATREEVRPIDDLRASADYRRHLAGVFARRAVEALLGGTA